MRAMLVWLLAVTLTIGLVEGARRFAPGIGLVDTPTDRKSHKGETPLVGGIAIFVALLIILPFFGVIQDHWAFLVAASMLVVVGIWDDVHGVSPIARLFFQGGAILFVALFGDAVLVDLGNISPWGGQFNLAWMSIPFTVFAGIGLINAFNMADGVDGLCGALALIALTGLGIMSAVGGKTSELVLIAILAGALAGFLVYNLRVPGRKHAKVFLGDAGSYLLGFSVLYVTVRLSQGADRAMAPVTALWFCMLPILDTVGMILRRIKRGKSPFSADREHIHHVFLLAKFTVTETWAGLTLVALVGMGVGLLGSAAQVPELTIFAAFAFAAFLYLWMIKRAWKVMRFLSRSINRRAAAKVDRRDAADRRDNAVMFYINGVAVERRSGQERRHETNDRRHPDDIAAQANSVTAQEQNPDRPGNRAARTS